MGEASPNHLGESPDLANQSCLHCHVPPRVRMFCFALPQWNQTLTVLQRLITKIMFENKSICYQVLVLPLSFSTWKSPNTPHCLMKRLKIEKNLPRAKCWRRVCIVVRACFVMRRYCHFQPLKNWRDWPLIRWFSKKSLLVIVAWIKIIICFVHIGLFRKFAGITDI